MRVFKQNRFRAGNIFVLKSVLFYIYRQSLVNNHLAKTLQVIISLELDIGYSKGCDQNGDRVSMNDSHKRNRNF